MNKNIFVVALIVIVAIGAYFFYMKEDAATPSNANVTTASYSNGSSVVNASFNTANDTVTFTQADVGTVTLPQAISGSGARYANANESIVFWEHQGEVTITKGGVEVFKGAKN